MINGINHITFAVADLDRSLDFYAGLLGLRLVGKWHKGAYLLAGSVWVALNVDPRTEPAKDDTHVAFHVMPADFRQLKEKLEMAGVLPFKENVSEGESFYFLDPDGHKLELHYNTLTDRLKWAAENNWATFTIVE